MAKLNRAGTEPEGRDLDETLRVIRRLMERGQVYEAISGRGALLAGLAAIAASAALHWALPRTDAAFLGTWLTVAAAAAAWTVVPATRRARSEGAAMSPQARAVALAVLPAYAAAAVLTGLLAREGLVRLLPPAWMLLHGVAILATWYHAPRRLVGLGLAFLAAGALAAVIPAAPAVEMAASFGAINVAYGALVLLRGAEAGDD